jgi:hypothetical protein
MDPERPPETDADYRVVHGPWPRWALQLSLLKLALRSAAIVLVLCLVAIAIAFAVVRLR